MTVIPAVLSIDEFLDPSAAWHAHAASNVCAVLGRPIEHSLSPLLHNSGYREHGLDFTYVRVEAGEAVEIRELLRHCPASVRGFSVTMPGKSAALELADSTTERAELIGSANTLVPLGDGTWMADNTDVDGVSSCLAHIASQGVDFSGSRAVVVGNGGTARPAVAALASADVQHVTVVARSERALNLQSLVEGCGMGFDWVRMDAPALSSACSDASTVISTIPAAGAELISSALLQARSVLDVIYDPYPTALLAGAMDRGLPHADGLRMLAGQAERQFELFTGTSPREGLLLKTIESVRQR
ncbi:shikimate dehydrogenase [Corynebacterium sp. 4HC-13]|uniref:shikimate dehydrogenase n=1 Tax=Corynebacterium anserum TaxID=2684406 RepID=UPI00163B2B1D|nr:shikimate dehydrogenase [Corynebacterium anserum]MBC2681632.1 shikimate dehydrogenase [Corynebacterium anserum]